MTFMNLVYKHGLAFTFGLWVGAALTLLGFAVGVTLVGAAL